LNVLVVRDTTLIAMFEKITYQITITDQDNTTSLTLDCEEMSDITPSSTNSCYKFKHWVDDKGQFFSDSNPLRIIVNQDMKIVAVYDTLTYELTTYNKDDISIKEVICGEGVQISANIQNECCIKFSH